MVRAISRKIERTGPLRAARGMNETIARSGFKKLAPGSSKKFFDFGSGILKLWRISRCPEGCHLSHLYLACQKAAAMAPQNCLSN